jgi:hypothetical protein
LFYCLADPAFAREFAQMVRDILNCAVPPSVLPFLRASLLVPIPKKPNGVRPIAVGEAFVRIAGAIALRAVLPGASAEFLGTQFALEKGGAEKIIHHARARLGEGKSIITIDFRNAFNSISRKAVAQAIAGRRWAAPACRIFEALYCEPSSLRWWGGTLFSTEGVRQGCVLSPLFFCIGVSDLIAETRRRFPSVETLCFMDDFSLVSDDAAQLAQAFSFIKGKGAEIGLEVNGAKSFAHGPAAANIEGAVFSANGLKLLGAWVSAPGGPDATQAHLEKTRLAHDTLFSNIPLLNAECAFAVLRSCALPVWSYQTRVHQDTVEQSKKFDDSVMQAFCAIARVKPEELSGDHKMLIHLPLDKGGAGLRSHASICAGNYEASRDPTGDDQETRTAQMDTAILAVVSRGPLEEHRAAGAKRNASAWLTGPSPDFSFPSENFAAALRYRIGLHESWGARTSRVCSCGFVCPSSAEFSHHILGCAKRKGAGVSTRHTALKNAFAHACRENRLTCRVEPEIRAGDRADLTIYSPDGAEDESQHTIDFTVTSCLAKTGGTEESATKKKNTRYETEGLVVAHMDATGGMSQAMCKIIRVISSFSEEEDAAARLRAIAAKTVQRFNGEILRRACLNTVFGAMKGTPAEAAAEPQRQPAENTRRRTEAAAAAADTTAATTTKDAATAPQDGEAAGEAFQ